MNVPSTYAGSGTGETGENWRRWSLLALLVSLVAISRQSLWIDEAFMAAKAVQPTLAGWWHMMPEGKGSDLQMPFYMIYVWGFARIFGFSEWALRAANIPWFVMGVTAFIRVFPPRQRLAAAAAVLVAPFAWYYLNEARPYAMQLGTSLIIFASLRQLSLVKMSPREEGRWFGAFCFGMIALCGSSLLGVIWAGAAVLSLPLLFSSSRLFKMVRSHLFTSLFTVGFLAGLGGYYIWTLHAGAKETNAAKTGNSALAVINAAAHFRQGLAGGTDVPNLVFLVYELLGLGGLGPGRVDIRTAGLTAFRPFLIPLVIYAFVVGGVLWLAVSRLYRGPDRLRRVGLAFVVALPMLLLLIAGYFLHFRVLGRHFTPVMPVLLLLFVVGLATAWSRRNKLSKLSAAIFLVLSMASCLSFRFATRHQKDDYRDAASAANAALSRGQQVWWSADTHGAAYYHVPLAAENAPTIAATLVQNPTLEALSHLPAPDVIVASKPDLYDDGGAVAEYLREGHYSKIAVFQAFTVWQRPGAPAAPTPP